MLFVCLSNPLPLSTIPKGVGGVELRLDLFTCIDIEWIQTFILNCSLPVMLTLRSLKHGGKYEGQEALRESLIQQLLALQPCFFDLEYDMRAEFVQEMIQRHHFTQFVLSYHNFEQTPEDLEAIYRRMVGYCVFSYKIAAMALSTNDALRMLLFSKKYPKVSAICMGEKGGFARILGPVVGNLIDYAILDNNQMSTESIATGQLCVSELMNVYGYHRLNRQTAIYGLIGNPVVNSLGHIYHNAVFHQMGLNAVYVKMCVEPQELASFLSLAKRVGIEGLSVTAPLKEQILCFVDEIALDSREIGAINTLIFKKERYLGMNSDGPGALDAIEKRILVRQKRVVLLGAGGVARAIAFEAKARGAQVWILNRTLFKAQKIAAHIGCQGAGLEDMPANYDVLVNCSTDPLPINPEKIAPGVVAMDVLYHLGQTAFLKAAALKGCETICGEEMFLNQAARQTAFWFLPTTRRV